MQSEQGVLFAPTGVEIPPLVLSHHAKSEAYRKQALIAEARGWIAVARGLDREADRHLQEAECLAMRADFERLAGLSQ